MVQRCDGRVVVRMLDSVRTTWTVDREQVTSRGDDVERLKDWTRLNTSFPPSDPSSASPARVSHALLDSSSQSMKTSSPAPCSDREILTDITSSSLINTLPRPSSSAPRRVSTLDTSSTPLSASGASEPASTPPSTLFGRRGREEDESSSCSPCASSPCPTLVGGTVGFKDNDGKVGGGQASKRRRVDASKETRLEGGRKVESLVGVGGRQVSVYEMVRRRALGFGGGREQGEYIRREGEGMWGEC